MQNSCLTISGALMDEVPWVLLSKRAEKVCFGMAGTFLCVTGEVWAGDVGFSEIDKAIIILTFITKRS